MILKDIDSQKERLDRLLFYHHGTYAYHDNYVQSFFNELVQFLNSQESVDLSCALLKEYVLKK